MLCHDGEIEAVCQVERLHQPVRGGPSTHRRTVDVDPDLMAHAQRLMQEIGWTGVAQIEFLVNETESYLTEVNGRFWGSLPTNLRAGMDFPGLLFDMMVDGTVPDGRPSYRTGVYCRNLFLDVDWFLENLTHPHDREFLLTKPWKAVMAELWDALPADEHWDSFTRD
ncbi:MAG: ATP-grasp domain-containing protein, partial [Candidatus Nanohaloarchaea archaeon]